MEELQAFYTFPSNERVGAGDYHTGLATERGSVYMLGSNEKGQLGREPFDPYINPRPRRVPLPGFAVAISCGGSFTLVKTGSGNIYAFGDGGLTKTPAVIFNGIEATAGTKHATLLSSEGQLHTFGEDSWGWMGYDHQGQRLLGRQLNFPQPIITASAGGRHTAFITESGQLYTFTYDRDWRINPQPTHFPLPYRAIAVSTGGRINVSTVVLTENGLVYTFGENNNGKLGTGDRLARAKPTYIPLSERIKDISVGEMYIAVVTVTGKLYVFGLEVRPILIPVPGMVREVSVGLRHIVMLTETGEFYGFGSNRNGQLGQCDLKDYNSPVLIDLTKPKTRCTVQ